MNRIFIAFVFLIVISCEQDKRPLLGETDYQKEQNAKFKDGKDRSKKDKEKSKKHKDRDKDSSRNIFMLYAGSKIYQYLILMTQP